MFGGLFAFAWGTAGKLEVCTFEGTGQSRRAVPVTLQPRYLKRAERLRPGLFGVGRTEGLSWFGGSAAPGER